jgi:putative protein kinase ArgK-like GTPase of G3E family
VRAKCFKNCNPSPAPSAAPSITPGISAITKLRLSSTLTEDEGQQAYCQTIVDELGWDGPVYQISALKSEGTRTLMFDIMTFLEAQQLQEKELAKSLE